MTKKQKAERTKEKSKLKGYGSPLQHPIRFDIDKFNPKAIMFPLVFMHIILMMSYILQERENASENRRMLNDILLTCLILIGSPLAQGLGHLTKQKSHGFHFWQPFSGGTTFIILQIAGWIIYAFGIIFALEHISYAIWWRKFSYIGGFYSYGIDFLHNFVGEFGNQEDELEMFRLRLPFFLCANILGITSHLITLISQDYFQTSQASAQQNQNSHPSKKEGNTWSTIVVFLLLVASIPFSLFIVNEIDLVAGGKGFLSRGWRIAATLGLFLAAPLTHIMASRVGLPEPVLKKNPTNKNSKNTEKTKQNHHPRQVEHHTKSNGKAHNSHNNTNNTFENNHEYEESLEQLVVSEEPKNQYKIFQPFIGGEIFVVLQIVAWSMYSFGLLAFLIFLFTEIVQPLYHWFFATAGLVSQGFLVGSFFFFERQRGWRDFKISKNTTLHSIYEAMMSFFVTMFFYQLPLNTFLFFLIICLILPFWGAALFMATFSFLYMLAYNPKDQETGSRKSSWIRSQRWIWNGMARYFSAQLFVEKEAVRKISKHETYVFGFHPHGIYPATGLWMSLSDHWKKIFPGVELEAVGASILLKTPIVRDVIMLCGTREVTKKAISHGLQNKVSILIIPGGQKEMRYWSPDKTKYIVVTKNKGFIKIALTQGAPLVPMFSFGENDILHNIQLPKIQELTYRYLGFGYPLFPYGRWYSAMPNPTQVSVCVGEPISVPQVTNPPDTLVDHYHQIYYQRLRELFEKYKVKAGYSNCELIYVD